jgi:hypothetical protein
MIAPTAGRSRAIRVPEPLCCRDSPLAGHYVPSLLALVIAQWAK